MTEFESTDDVIWCRAACGNNIHKQCFEQWAKSKLGQVKCVYCRTPWQPDDLDVKKAMGTSQTPNREGYVNIAGELGISGVRDTSMYNWSEDYW